MAFRRVERADLSKLMKWRVSEEVTKYMYTDPGLDLKKQEEWFAKVSDDDTIAIWVVSYNGHDFAVAHLYDINLLHKRCFWGYYIGEQSLRNKGLSKQISCNIYDHVFYKLNLNKICGEVIGYNEKVIRMAEKRGFDVEGVFKQHIFKNGQFHDVIRIALMKYKWDRIRTSFGYEKVKMKDAEIQFQNKPPGGTKVKDYG